MGTKTGYMLHYIVHIHDFIEKSSSLMGSQRLATGENVLFRFTAMLVLPLTGKRKIITSSAI